MGERNFISGSLDIPDESPVPDLPGERSMEKRIERLDVPERQIDYQCTSELSDYIKDVSRLDVVGGETTDVEATLLATVLPRLNKLSENGVAIVLDVGGNNVTEQLFVEAIHSRVGGGKWEVHPDVLIELQRRIDPTKIPDLIAGAMPSSKDENSDMGMTERDILEEICTNVVKHHGRPGAPSTLAQINGGLRELTKKRDTTLTAKQSDILDQTITDRPSELSRLRTFVSSLQTDTTHEEDRTPYSPSENPKLYDFTVTDDGGIPPRTKINLLMNSMLLNIKKGFPFGAPELLVITGAERVHPRDLERLSTLCDQVGVPQIFFHELTTDTRDRTMSILGRNGAARAVLPIGNGHDARMISDTLPSEMRWVTTSRNVDMTLQEVKPDMNDPQARKLFGRRGYTPDYESTMVTSSSQSYTDLPDVHRSVFEKLDSLYIFVDKGRKKGQTIIEVARPGRVGAVDESEPYLLNGQLPDAELAVQRLWNWREQRRNDKAEKRRRKRGS